MTSPVTGHAYLDVRPAGAARGGRRVIAFAHRGGAYHPEIEGLENTLAAFEHAVELGYRYLETDVHLTADGVLLAFHDEVLDRVTDSAGEVAALSHAEVRRARVGGRESVPTLVELLDAFPDARFNIDLKSEGAVDALAALVAERGEWDRLLVGSFSPARLRRFRRLTAGRVPTSAHPFEAAAFALLPGRLADRLTRGRVAALQVPHRRTLRFAGLSVTVPVVTTGFVRRVHAAGKHVHVWTIDEPGEMRELLEKGVDGLFTDRTDVLREVLEEQGLWEGTT
ncbi:glycerophosphodiester phosphodiesterase [Nocardioides marinus]|uniref:Glycerophosphoryl diester phosphodiesterase n=1 Tax=Nocardioides marinus TaxID=374514 RepID=A0A7Y9YDJ6_9ACTN|nr:glycerophosphoryl diester phosphodiesterase [Nocardioides marinus]